jgi:hypothetical protein
MEFLASCSSIAVLLDSYQENFKHENEDEGKSDVVSLGSLKQIQEDESKGVSEAPTRPHNSKPSRARKGPRNVLSVSDHTGLKPTRRKNEMKGSTSKNTGLGAMDCDLIRRSTMLKKTSETIGKKIKPNSNNARSEKAQLELRLTLEASQERYHAALQDSLHQGVPHQVVDLDLIGKGLDADGDVSDVSSSTPPLRRRKAPQEKRLQRSQSMRNVRSPSPRSSRARRKSIDKKTQHEKGRVQHSQYFRDLRSPSPRVSHRGRRKSGNAASASPQTPRTPVQRQDWPTDTRSRRNGVENHEIHDGPKKATNGLSSYPTKTVERSQSLRDLFRDDERRNMDSPNRDPGTPLSEESVGDSAGRKPASWRDLYNKSPRYAAGRRISGTQSTSRPPSGRSLGRIDSLEVCGRRSRRSGSLQMEDKKETPPTPARGLERSNGERDLSEAAQTGLLLATYRSPQKMPRRRSDVSRATQPARNIVLGEHRESKSEEFTMPDNAPMPRRAGGPPDSSKGERRSIIDNDSDLSEPAARERALESMKWEIQPR